ncbi:MAG: glycosyltransferase family 4 protein [candidate division WOR-3 bacterium]
MKLLHITTAFKRNKEDIITPWLVDLLEEQSKTNKVFVLTSGYKNVSKKQKYKKIKIFRFNYAPNNLMKITHDYTIMDYLKFNKKAFFLLPLFFLTGIIENLKILKNEKIDFIFVHWPFPLFFISFPAKLFFKKKIISVFYGAELKLFKKSFFGKKIILNLILKNSYKIVAISSYTKKQIEEITCNKKYSIEVIPYGVRIEEKINFSEKENIILFVGRLVERKGVDYLIKAMKFVKTDYKLYIVGDGYKKSELEKLVKKEKLSERVKFLGFVGDKDLIEYYRKSKIFVLPAIHDRNGDTEGLGMVLVEAIVNGTVSIGTNVGGIVDIIEDRVTGLLVREKDEKELADKINYIIENEKMYKELQENGFKKIKEKFSIDSVNRKYMDLINE